MPDFAIAIIAGGQSSRMGTDKAFALLDGKPLIAHLLARLADMPTAETLLITNRPDDYAHLKLPMHQDILPGKGSLGGIYTALLRSQAPYTLVLACDMPFINPALLRYMIARIDEASPPHDVIVPRVAGRPQGLHAIYSARCADSIRARLDQDQLKVIGFYDAVRTRYLDEPEYHALDAEGLSFYNINTPEDLANARRINAQARTSAIASRLPAQTTIEYRANAMPEPGAVPHEYWILHDGRLTRETGGVIEEVLLSIYVNGQALATLMCSPLDREALTLGFLYNEHVIETAGDVQVLALNANGNVADVFLTRADFDPPRRVVLTSGCSGGLTFQDLNDPYPPLATDYTTTPQTILARLEDLHHAATLHTAVGGVHTALLGTAQGVLFSAEDIGRHNTIDKLAGKALQSNTTTNDAAIFVTGRISSEMLAKARRMAVPLVVSRTSPTSMAVRLADAWNICIVGYARHETLRVYTHPQRIVMP